MKELFLWLTVFFAAKCVAVWENSFLFRFREKLLEKEPEPILVDSLITLTSEDLKKPEPKALRLGKEEKQSKGYRSLLADCRGISEDQT